MGNDRSCSDSSGQPNLAAMSVCARKLNEIVQIWQRAGVSYDDMARSIDRCHVAARVVDRFRREQPDLAGAVATAKSLDSDAALHAHLEGHVRKWDLSETDAYRQLIVLAQGFASTPAEPEGFGLWFRVIHQERWVAILSRTGLDEEGLFKFIRHVMKDDGLSAPELYEKMIDLSDDTVLETSAPAAAFSVAPDADESSSDSAD